MEQFLGLVQRRKFQCQNQLTELNYQAIQEILTGLEATLFNLVLFLSQVDMPYLPILDMF